MSGHAEAVARHLDAKGPNREGWWTARCPFPQHDDQKASFSFTKDGYKCFGCGRQGPLADILVLLGLETQPRSTNGKRLTAEDADRLLYNRGLRAETIQRFRIEADVSKQAWRFPMANGSLRYKSFDGSAGVKTWWGGPADGAELYGMLEAREIVLDVLYLVEGEPDVWIARQAGLPAVTFTRGANTVPAPAVRQLAAVGLPLRIIYDWDEAGRAGAVKAAEALRAAGVDVEVLELPNGLPPGGDLTNLYSTLDHDDAAFREVVASLDLMEADCEPAVAKYTGVTLADFRAYMPLHKYIFVPARELWPAVSVNARFPRVHAGKKGLKASTWLDQNQPVEQMTWAPGEPALIEDRLISHGGWIERPGVTCFNLYRPPMIELGDAEKVGPWLDHVYRVYPDQAEHIVAWLAHRVQRPGEKVNHALVLQGPQGTGKDTIIQGAIPAVGSWNVAEVSPDQLLGRFNGFVKSVILRLSEARDLGDLDRYRLYDHMKVYTASPPLVLRCDEKYIPEYSVPNVCGVIITTNYVDGIYLPADDRRHFVAWTDQTKEDFTEEYWTDLYRWYEVENGYGHVAAYLAKYDLSEFNSKAPPPKTSAFWAVADAGRAPEDAELADALEKLGHPDAVTLTMIVQRAESGFADWLQDRRSARMIPHRMEVADYVSVRNDSARDGRWKLGGRRQVVYARRGLSLRDRIDAVNRLVESVRA